MAAGVLTAWDLMMLACTSKHLKHQCDEAWCGIRAGNRTTKLKSVERRVDDPRANESKVAPFVPIAQASPCFECQRITRYHHPLADLPCCATCGGFFPIASDYNPVAWPSYIASERQARERFLLAPRVELGRHLWWMWGERLEGYGRGPDGYMPSWDVVPYAHAARDVDRARSDADDGWPRPLRPEDPRAPPMVRERYFLWRDVATLMVEKFGGAVLLTERAREQGLPLLDPAKPDE